MSPTPGNFIDVSDPGRGDEVVVRGPGGSSYVGYVRSVSLDLDRGMDYGMDRSYRGSGAEISIGGPIGPTDMTIELSLDGRQLSEFVGRRGKGSGKTKKKDNEENHMYIVTIVKNKSTKSATVHVQKDPKVFKDLKPGVEVYLARTQGSDPASVGEYKEVERSLGGDMPIYATFPDELFVPLVAAAQREGY